MNLVIESAFQTGGYEDITVNGAVGFTDVKIRPTTGDFKGMTCQSIFATLETDYVRFTLDGTTPTDTVGHLLSPGENLTLRNASDIANFQTIKVTANASLKVTYKF